MFLPFVKIKRKNFSAAGGKVCDMDKKVGGYGKSVVARSKAVGCSREAEKI